MKKITSLLVLSLALLSGCSSTQKATIVGNKITNPTVGFNGYETPIPIGYVIADPSDQVGKEIINMAHTAIEPQSFTRSLGGAYIRDKIIMYDKKNNSYISFFVLELNIPGSLSQIPAPKFEKFKERIERSSNGQLSANFTEHYDLGSPYTLEFHGSDIAGIDPIITSGYFTFGKLNEIIAVVGHTTNIQSHQEFEDAVRSMMFGTKIL
tara:strand:+ start:255 stop:881 length:627 start_codon:yes stop_codon:yes gene_type:complete